MARVVRRGSLSGKLDLKNPATIRAVWEKGQRIPKRDPSVWRRDKDGHMIKFDEYGNRNSAYGWEIDHIRLVSDEGTDELSNLRPLYWRTNAKRQEDATGRRPGALGF